MLTEYQEIKIKLMKRANWLNKNNLNLVYISFYSVTFSLLSCDGLLLGFWGSFSLWANSLGLSVSFLRVAFESFNVSLVINDDANNLVIALMRGLIRKLYLSDFDASFSFFN